MVFISDSELRGSSNHEGTIACNSSRSCNESQWFCSVGTYSQDCLPGVVRVPSPTAPYHDSVSHDRCEPIKTFKMLHAINSFHFIGLINNDQQIRQAEGPKSDNLNHSPLVSLLSWYELWPVQFSLHSHTPLETLPIYEYNCTHFLFSICCCRVSDCICWDHWIAWSHCEFFII